MQIADADDYDIAPPLLTDAEAQALAREAIPAARLRRRGRRCAVEVREPAVVGIGATWEQALDCALTGLGR